VPDQIVCFAHRPDYRAHRPARQYRSPRTRPFYEANGEIRCIVAMQHLGSARDGGQMTNQSSKSAGTGEDPVVVKKYANRRLYNTATSSYVTLEDLARMIKDGGIFVVYDAKSGE